MLQGTEERRGKGDERASEPPRAESQTTAAQAWALELSPGKRHSVQKDPRIS